MTETNNYKYQNIFEEFDSSPQGLDNNEVNFRLQKHGKNILELKQSTGLITQFIKSLLDPMTVLLIVSAILAFFIGNSIDAFIILAVLSFNSFISFLQKYKAEKDLEALKQIVSPQGKVIRNHQKYLINTSEIVPSDIILVEEGDTIPADAIIFESNELEVMEAILNGESTPISKTAHNYLEKGAYTNVSNFIFAGTTVTRGNAHALVVRTGLNTELGKIAQMTTKTKKDLTPLEKEIHNLGFIITQITLVIIAIIFVIELLIHQKGILENILFAASIAVAAVPEGLPAVITITLALGVQRLSKKNAIVKQLSSVETLGATTVICTDKTGTLTKNEMTVTQLITNDSYIKLDGIGYEPNGNIQVFEEKTNFQINNNDIHSSQLSIGAQNTLHYLNLAAYLCNNSSLNQKDNKYNIIGDPTEGSLKTMVLKMDKNFESNIQDIWEEIHELPFDSDRKVMSKLFFNKQKEKYILFVKGAPEFLLKLCDQRLNNGKANILTKGVKEEAIEYSQQLSSKALRTLAFAYRELNSNDIKDFANSTHFSEKTQILEKKLTYIGMVGIIDPPRVDVKESIRLTQIAGIRTIIITGDNGLTAKAIAEEIELSPENNSLEIINGDQLNEYSDQQIKDFLSDKTKTLIFARVKPEHKLKIVSLLKELGEVVAVTGDGVNDAPALKKSDIGVAMGKTGSDIAKEVSSLVLMDESFKTIVEAIKEGRTIFDNLKKFIFYMFSSNIGEVTIIFLALLIGLPSPLTAVLILVINFATDLLPALALGFEPAEKDIMLKPPRSANEKIITKTFIMRIIIIGVSLGIISLSLYMFKLINLGWFIGNNISNSTMNTSFSIVFISLVFLQIINSFDVRSKNQSIFTVNPFGNWRLLWGNIISLAISIAIVEVPILQNYFHTNSLNLIDWITILIGGVIFLIILEMTKFLPQTAYNESSTSIN